jgi:dihydroneopterin aldolase
MSTATATVIPIAAKDVAKSVVRDFGASLRSNVEIMKAYKKAYMRVWREQNREHYRELQRASNKRYAEKKKDLLETLKRELAEARAQLDTIAQRAALAQPTTV